MDFRPDRPSEIELRQRVRATDELLAQNLGVPH